MKASNFWRGIVLAGLAAAALAPAANAEEPVLYFGHTGEVRTIDSKAFTDFGSPTATHTTSGMTFNLFYEDIRLNNNIGFDDPSEGGPARARILDVLDYLALTLGESGTLDIFFDTSQTDAGGFLASAGSFYSFSNGVHDPSSMRRIQNGTKPFASSPEIFVTVDFGFLWNYTDDPTDIIEVDFFSVMLHEFTHGLGIAGLTNSNGQSAFAPTFANGRTVWDTLMVRNQGGSNIVSGAGAFVGNVADLTSDSLFCEGVQSTALYDQGGTQPGVYAPTPFASGSSLSHWDTGNIIGGAVMEHAINFGEDQREYAGVDLGGLIDIGWDNVVTSAEGEGEGVIEGEGEGSGDPATVSIDVTGGSTVEEGGAFTLSAVVENGTAIDYQWRKGATNIPSEENPTLVRNSAVIADSGIYRVTVETAAKAVIESAPVSISVVPVGGLPVGGTLALSVMAITCALAGSMGLRRRK
jgi:hypothetical protein